jgi:hypothetical protein
MSRAFEYLLKAENYALAAKMAEGRKRMALLGAAAYWRNRAFDVRMGRLQQLRESPDSETTGQGTAD